MYERTREKIELTDYDKLRFSRDWFLPLISVELLSYVNIMDPPGNLGALYMTPGRLSRRSEFTPVPSHGSTFVYMMGAIHSTKISGNFGPKLNGSVRSNRKSFEKTGPPFEVVLFSRSDRSEFWLNGSRPIPPQNVMPARVTPA